MQLLVIFCLSLLLYIPFDRLLIALATDRANIVAIAPEFTAPQLLLDFRGSLEDFSRRETLHHLDDLFRTVGRYRLDQKMHMVLVGPNFDKLDLIALRNVQTDLFQNFIHMTIKHRSAIFGWTNKMVQQNRNVMAFPDQFAHPPILAQQAAGKDPH